VNASCARPQTKFAAALVAAGVVTAASLVAVPENRSLPVLNIDVAKASVITDALYGLGNAIDGVDSGVLWASVGGLSLPFEASTVIALAAQNPSIAPNLLSYLVQRYVNPSDNFSWVTYPWLIKTESIEPLAALLPSPLSDDIISAVNGIADAINDALAGLPSADPGGDAVVDFLATDIGRTFNAVNLAVTVPAYVLSNIVSYLGYLPADLEATLESAIQDPSEIPGLASNLLNLLLSPDPNVGLLGILLQNVSDPLTTLPGPIGELANNTVTAISDSIDNLLSLLPPPISPTPFPSALKVAQVEDVQVEAVPDQSLAVGAITVSSVGPVETVEKKVEAPDSTDNTPPVTPQDPAPAAGEADPAAPPAADPDVPKVKPDKPGAHSVKSGNKVSPGDKFDNQPKDETVKDETVKDETVKDTGADATPSDADDPTGPQAGETAGADDSDPGNASGAAA
jgi:molybdopterin-guanine dinucleotide biosynthesis protein A